MSDLNRTQTFADGDLVTALKLNNLVDQTTINPTFVSSKGELEATGLDKETDTVLLHDFSTSTLKKVKIKELLVVPVTLPALTATVGNVTTLTTSIIDAQDNKGMLLTPKDGVSVSGVNWVSANGLTVTVTSIAHGLVSGSVLIITASNTAYSADIAITVTTVDQFTYTLLATNPARVASAGTLSYVLKGYIVVDGRFKSTGNTDVGGNLNVSGNINLSGELSIANKPATQSFVPAGAIMPFAQASVPNGWLKANGQLVSRTTYADLFSAIGTTYGTGDGSTTFTLPDLRGEFIRGFDDGRGVDASRVLGSSQGDLLKKHKHNSSNSDCQSYGSINGVTTGNYNVWCDTNGIAWGGGAAPLTGDGTHGIETGIAGTSIGVVGAETRPRNISLLYCIKF